MVEVRFKGNRKAYFEWHDPEPQRATEPVIVESERGLDYGLVSAMGAVAQLKCDRCQGYALNAERERDEAGRLGGIGCCGRELCSASWLPELRPIGLHIAKDLWLSLIPAQISGPCGRLLCCLRYEHEFYVQSRKRFPKAGKIVRTAKGFEKVYSVDIFRDRVTVRGEDGTMRVVPLLDLKAEMEAAQGREAPAAIAVAPA